MEKKTIAEFFDKCAPWWDADMIRNEPVIAAILDNGGIREGAAVLDVACGTGVLFPYYLARNVALVTAVDISPEMARIAAEKTADPRVRVICGDVETLPVDTLCDCCVIYNAFPHFVDPSRLAERLAAWVKPGGRLTVAHGMSLEALDRHHAAVQHVSRGMLTTEEMTEVLSPWFAVDVTVSDAEKYIVSGVRHG